MIGWSFFGLSALSALVGALLTVLTINPIRGAMALLLSILGITGLFLALHAEFLAAVELIVYAGAVVVLFVFVIMLIGPESTPPQDRRGIVSRSIGGLTFGAGAIVALLLLTRSMGVPRPYLPAHAELGTIDMLGREFFTRGLLPFVLSTVLFVVAVLGAIAIARGKQKSPSAAPAPPEDEPTPGSP